MKGGRSTTDSATAGEAPQVPLRAQFLTAGVCLVMLMALAWHFDFGRTRTVFSASWQAPTENGSAATISPEPESATNVRYSEPFEIGRATTVAIDLQRSAVEGLLLVDCALVDLERGETRVLVLESGWTPGPGGEPDGELEDGGRIDRVAPGRYVVRFDPDWRGTGAAPPPELQVRVTTGGRSAAPFTAAAALLVAPAAVSVVRRWQLGRRRKGRA